MGRTRRNCPVFGCGSTNLASTWYGHGGTQGMAKVE